MYSLQIDRLKAILEHLEALQKGIVIMKEDLLLDPFQGLCQNAFLLYLPLNILLKIIDEWEFKDFDTFNDLEAIASHLDDKLVYFIDGKEEYQVPFKERKLYSNPKRISFIKHALQYLEKLQGEVT